MLSIITMICDGTESLLDNWVQNAQEKVKIEKELIVVDNTTAQTVAESSYYKVVKMGHNAMQFAGRRAGVEAAKGDYIFLVDCDDEILPINSFNWDEELICFNYMATKPDSKDEYICSNPYTLSYTASKGIFFDYNWRNAVKNMVWNKFYSRDLLLRVYSKLPYFEICFMEDVLLNIFVLAEVKSIRFEAKAFYRYFFGTGVSTKKVYTDIEPLKRLFVGMETALSVFNLAFSKEAQEQSGLTTIGFYRGCIEYALEKYGNLAPGLEEPYTKMIGKYFDKALLLKVLKNQTDRDIDRKTMLKAKHCINDYMDN